MHAFVILFFFFFQAEDGIRDVAVTGVQTCALPISLGTARLVHVLAGAKGEGRADPLVLVVSTSEVYGCGEPPPRPRRETDPVAPCSPYAASKAGAELATLETWRRAGLRVVVARPFAHTGPGQRRHDEPRILARSGE